MRPFLFLLALLLCLVSCEQQVSTTASLTRYIPRKSAVIIKTASLRDLVTEVKNNKFLSALDDTGISGFIKKQSVFLDVIETDDETLICYTPIAQGEYEVTVVSKAMSAFFKNDSTATGKTKLGNIQSRETAQGTFYYLMENETAILSTSQLLLENIIRERKEDFLVDKDFDRAYNATSSNATASILLRGEAGQGLWSTLFPKATTTPLEKTVTWLSADIDLNDNDIVLSGVALVRDSIGLRMELLKKTHPVVNRIMEVTPLSALGVSAVTYHDWNIFKENQALFQKRDPSKFIVTQEEALSTFQEVGLITVSKGEAIVAVSADVELSEQALAGNEEVRIFRDVAIHSFGTESASSTSPKTSFAKAYHPLLPLPTVNVYCKIDDFYIFSADEAVLETVIANYQNNATLGKSEAFLNTARRMSDASSYLHIEPLLNKRYATLVTDEGRKKLGNSALESYPYLATQLVQERDFMHFNLVINQNESPTADGAVSEIANVKLNAELLMSPQLVKNHRTKGMDAVIQDINHTVYLVSNAGKVLWQKELDGPILGDVQQVDLYRNGRLQLAFVTDKTFHILDRNGNEVKPFPMTFKDPITQPLSIFDYENNRNYRFVIVQNDEVLMYDKKAAPVTGFKFSKTGSPVVFPPKHIRLKNKDYIIVAEDSGKLHILSRTGTSRVAVDKEINFGDTPVFDNGNAFIIYNVNGDKLSISQSGKVTEDATDIGSDAKIIQRGRTRVSLRENDLRINNTKVELPFGRYSEPVLTTVGKSTYIGLTNLESKEVYIFDIKGIPLESLPVYGISKPSLGFLERNKSLGFVVQGDSSSMLIYKIN